jgi:hypothetical protein
MRTLGLPPGPEVGRVLAALLEQVIEQPGLNTRPRCSRAWTHARGRGHRLTAS